MAPSAGVISILKSPVWTIVPAGLWMARATASAMEWFTWMSSTSMQPICRWDPGGVTCSRAEPVRPCSFSFPSMRPMVRAVPYTGTFSFFSR